MTCTEIQQRMLAAVLEGAEPGHDAAVKAHLADCTACRSALREMTAAWQALETLPEHPVPAGTKRTILQRAREAAAPSGRALLSGLRAWLLDWRNPVLPILMGLLTTSVFALVLELHMDLSLIPPLGLTLAGAMWTGLFALVFYLFSMGMRLQEHSWRFLAQTSLVAIGIFFVITVFSPLPHSVRFCSNFNLTQPLMERLSIGGAYFVFGVVYALVPMAIGAFVAAGRYAGHPLLRGSLAGGVFMLLLAPAIFLQCAPFALGVVLGWFGGALLGSLIGGALGYWIRFRALRQSA
ncbi:MAG: zf-HC2 domain-containing protein [candidate division KSB1 bacterium]|nr:zf-HC2 domain-containing protein [candidate division KSB1 bacterium]